MIQINRSFRSTLLIALLCGTATVSLLAQGPGGPPPGGRHGPPPSPLFDALDTNHDGVISAEEMANASTSLKSLLKNGATQLRREDLRPAAPPPRADAGDQSSTNAEDQHPHPRGVRPHGPPPHLEDQAANDAPGGDPAANDAAKPDPQADGPGNPPRHHGPPPSPLFDVLDTNHDGVISADEMGKASASLKSLLKDGATQLRREDLRPAHPPHPHEN